MNRYWMLVFIAGFFEVLWVTGLKYASNWLSWTGTAIAIILSFAILMRSINKLPVGTVYAVFTGMGTAGTVLVEMVVYGEPFRWMKIFLMVLLLSGVVGLKLVTREDSDEKGAAA